MGPVSLDVEKDIMEIVVMNRARRNVWIFFVNKRQDIVPKDVYMVSKGSTVTVSHTNIQKVDSYRH